MTVSLHEYIIFLYQNPQGALSFLNNTTYNNNLFSILANLDWYQCCPDMHHTTPETRGLEMLEFSYGHPELPFATNDLIHDLVKLTLI